MGNYHIPVLPKESLDFLNVRNGQTYIDCTLGGGGHTRLILEAGGKVMAMDQDEEALANARETLKKEIADGRLILKQGNFAHLKVKAQEEGITEVAGILFDLGVSTHQLDTPERGFSFNTAAPLDMRMNQGYGATAADLVNAGGETELANLIFKYGEERMARPIAKAIVAYRSQKPIETTDELAQIILSVRGRGKGDRTHPATRTFQALRVAVNSELDVLEEALPSAVELLSPTGRLVVISFHSLEDRIVKNFLNNQDNLEVITDKPVMATDEEVKTNPRSHSAKLRAAAKK